MDATLPMLCVLRQTPAMLRGILAGATGEQMRWRPAPERWSIAMVLAHLAEVEVHGFLQRFRAMAEQESPFLPSYDQEALFRPGEAFDAAEQLEKFERERRKTLEWLESQPAEAGRRTGRHQELGVITFDEMLHEFAFHDLGHLRQVAEIYRAGAFYPWMGALQRFYKINP